MVADAGRAAPSDEVPDESLEGGASVSETGPEDANAAGFDAFEDGDYEAAIAHFTVALEQESLPTLYYYRGISYDMTDRPEEALADLSKCLEAEPDHTWAMFSRHRVYRKTKQWESAFADVLRAYEVDSGDFLIANAYAQMLATSPVDAHRNADRNAEQAVKIATHACELTNWEDPLCVQTLANAYRGAGNVAKANEYDQKVREVESSTFDYDYEIVREEIEEYFTYHMGKPPNERGIGDTISLGKVDVSVWTIDRGDPNKPNLIYTTGMSEQPMAVPEDVDDGPFAEVCMKLSPDWTPQPNVRDDATIWPWYWLRTIAHYPHEEKTWIGEYPSVFPVGGPLEPLGRYSGFTALLLIPNLGQLEGFRSDEGPFINIITAMPIYTEEYELAKTEGGFKKLFARFQELGITTSLQPNRPNAALRPGAKQPAPRPRPPEVATPDEELAVAAIHELGGKTEGSPVFEVKFSKCKIADSDLRHIARLPALRTLKLRDIQITGDGLKYPHGLTFFEELDCSRTPITDDGVAHLEGLTQLRSLHLCEANISDAGIAHLEELTELEELWLDSITNEGLGYLKGMTKLKKLTFGGTQVDDAGLEHLAGLTNLSELWAEGTEISGPGLRHLSGMKHLRSLLLCDSPVDDSGLEHLKGLTSLEWLRIDGTQVSDAGLVHLKGLTNLRLVFLGNTQVTDAGRRELQRLLPNCGIR